MIETFNPKITAFKNLYEPKGTPIELTLEEVYNSIKIGSPTLIDKINIIRTTKDSKLKGETKNSLKCIMFNGVFSERTGTGLIEHSGIAVLDFDKYPSPEIMEEERQRLIKDKYTLMLFTSPSGNGLKALIKIPKSNKQEHKLRGIAYSKYINSPYFDLAQTTIEQTCFESYDKDVYFNPNSSVFNEIEIIEQAPVNYTNKVNTIKTALSPFEDYNNRGDVVGLLQRHGWRFTNQVGAKVNLLRPGQTDTKHSGNFHTDLRTFSVFTTSTIFEDRDKLGNKKAYSPSDVYSILECNGDKKLTYRRLLEEGYGEPIDNKAIQPTQVKNITTQVEIVNKVTGVNRIISNTGETLKAEDIVLNNEDILFITTSKETTTEEILNTIELTEKRCYIIENGVEIVSYRYQLIAIFNKYAKLQEETGELTDRQLDSLLTEIVETASKLQPIDKTLFINLFLEQEPIKNLGITQEALNITIDKITATKEREQQKTEFNNLIKEVNKLQESGEINEALDLLDTRVKEVKLKDKVTEFNSLLQPVNETDLRTHLTNKPESIKSGYTIGGEELLLPSGAISVFCAPTSHGKTSMLINLALNTSEQNKEKQVYLFSYEEDRESILIKTLNTYLDTTISGNNRTTLENYFSGKNRVTLPAQKDTFFKELIETNRLNIVYSNYNSDTLIEAIRYLKKTTNVGAVFIDYIQLLNLPQGKYKTYSRQEELKNICISLKDIAVETGLPIVIGAQFNREVTTLQKIHATKIGEAGDIERIASLIVGFWNTNFKPIGTQGEVEECYKKLDYLNNGIKGESLYSIVLKNRGGKVGGEELLGFNGNTGKIKNSIKEELPKY